MTARELATKAADAAPGVAATLGSHPGRTSSCDAGADHPETGQGHRRSGRQEVSQRRGHGDAGESEASRREHLKSLGIEDSPDVDRARFNLGGSGIGLAKLSRGAEAEQYLRAAHQAYQEAKQIRIQRYGEGIALPAIAACDNGIALAYYYGALLEADPLRDDREAYCPITPQTRMLLLRQATAACAEAFDARSQRGWPTWTTRTRSSQPT